MCDKAGGGGKSDRYSFSDPSTILNNFFNPGGKGSPKVLTGFDKDGKAGGGGKFTSDSKEEMDLIADSCIDWGALTPREIAAAFMMLKGGSKEEAQTLLTNVLAELDTMETADWGLLDTSVDAQDKKPSSGKKTKFYSGL